MRTKYEAQFMFLYITFFFWAKLMEMHHKVCVCVCRTEDSACLRPISQLDLLFGLDKMNESKQATAPPHTSAGSVN